MRFKSALNQASKVKDLLNMINTLAKYDERLILM